MNKKNSFVFSIITPVYNREDCILRCLDSIIKQDFCGYEVIVINDGSKDNTFLKIESYQDKIPNLNFISYSDNKGVNYARNRGIEQAKGDFIIFLDSDDQLTNNALSTIEQHIKNYQGFSHYLFGVSDRVDDGTIPKEKRLFTYKDWLSGVVSGDFAHVIKPECFEGLLFVEEFRIYESLNWLRVLRQNKTQLFIPAVVSERERERADSVTRESILNNKKSMQNNYNYLYQFLNWYGDDLKEFSLYTPLKESVQKALLLGIALKENSRNNELYNKLGITSFKFTLLIFFNKNVFSSLFYRIIQLKSTINQTILR